MGLLRRRPTEPATEERFNASAVTSFVNMLAEYGPNGGMSIDRALRISTAWACVRVLSGSVSILPVDAVRSQGAERVVLDPAPMIVEKPSGMVTRGVWLAQVTSSMFTDGNVWGFVGAVDRRGVPTSIETINPENVTDRRVTDNVPTARVDGELHRRFPAGDLWHVPGPMVLAGSPFGLSPVRYATGSLNTSHAAEQFGFDFFGGGGHPSSIIYADDPNLTDRQASMIKRAWIAATTGREPAVLGAGLKHEQVQVSPEDSQFIDLLRFQIENQCRFFGVPPSMAYAAVSGQSVTYTNVSQADLAYLKHSLQVPLVRLEEAWGALLARGTNVRINRDAILAADTLTRYQAHSLALRDQWKTPNEVRALEDEPPVPWGDEPIRPAAKPTYWSHT